VFDLGTYLRNWEPRMLSILRIMVGLLYMQHGLNKLLDFPPSANPRPCVKEADDDGLPDLLNEDIPTRPDPTDSRFDLEAIAPGVWPTAFSNPFLLNLDGGDWTAPGL